MCSKVLKLLLRGTISCPLQCICAQVFWSTKCQAVCINWFAPLQILLYSFNSNVIDRDNAEGAKTLPLLELMAKHFTHWWDVLHRKGLCKHPPENSQIGTFPGKEWNRELRGQGHENEGRSSTWASSEFPLISVYFYGYLIRWPSHDKMGFSCDVEVSQLPWCCFSLNDL